MRCGLKSALGVTAPCDETSCAFWRGADNGLGALESCVLVHYGLTGCNVDQTMRWLYEYKLSAERSRLAAYMHNVAPSHVISARRTAKAGVA